MLTSWGKIRIQRKAKHDRMPRVRPSFVDFIVTFSDRAGAEKEVPGFNSSCALVVDVWMCSNPLTFYDL